MHCLPPVSTPWLTLDVTWPVCSMFKFCGEAEMRQTRCELEGAVDAEPLKYIKSANIHILSEQ